MRVPLHWLHEYCAPALSAAELAERLALTGTEVERVERYGVTATENFVVGRVLAAEPHPDADRLKVCLVDVGGQGPTQIVCGAPNVAAGQTVAVARPGAVMPDGTKLGRARLRGQESDGMILAEDELAIGTDHAGILVLGGEGDGDGLRPGMPLEQVLPIATDVLVLEVTPNRPDCLGIYGVAREVHAATGAELCEPPWTRDAGAPGPLEGIDIEVECPELCPRFTARIFDDVRIGPSPPWLKAKLMAAGQRPISNVVDITNYAMLLTGQPLHAFDLDRVSGARLTVRRAREGETVQTLDGQIRTLDSDMVLIADLDGSTSIAGVMGGARSEVEPTTTRVLMEVANWHGANIHRTSLALGLRSEASGRFEKGLAPEQALEAQAVASELMIRLCGARVRSGTVDVGGPGPPPRTIRLRDRRVEGLLGAPVARDRARRILDALEFDTTEAQDGLDVTVPAFRRNDVTREADLIEEVARLDGLEALPATLPSRHGASGRLTSLQRLRRRAVEALAAQGLYEIIGWSFASPQVSRRLRLPDIPAVRLANPMSAEQSQLRTTLLGSLLDVARHNLTHGAGTVRLFESGAVYLPAGDAGPYEPHRIAAVLIGEKRPSSWREGQAPPADFFAAKGALQGMLEAVRVPFTVESSAEPFLHPGRAAAVRIGEREIGWLGEVHPQVAAEWEIEPTVAAFEIDLDLALEASVSTPLYQDLTSFPAVREDLAVVVSEEVPAASVLAVVREAGGTLLARAEVFDVYRDPERVGSGRVSLALRLTYRAPDRTLTDEEVAGRRQAIALALSEQLGGRVRGG